MVTESHKWPNSWKDNCMGVDRKQVILALKEDATPRADARVCERSAAGERGDLAVYRFTRSGHRGSPPKPATLCLCVCVTKVCL